MGDYTNFQEEEIFKRLRVVLFWDGVTLFEICVFYTTLENKEMRLENRTVSNEEDAIELFETWCRKLKDNSFWDHRTTTL